MTNKEIARLLKLTATLLELHGENQFKIRIYTNAVINIEKQEDSLFEKSKEELEALEGIGKGLAQSLIEIQETESFAQLNELLDSTPVGVIEMLELKGIGPKKIKVVWEVLNIESIDQLYEACKLGQLAKLKGFGSKTQETILQNLEYLISQRGKVLYAEAEPLANQLLMKLKKNYPSLKVEITGEMRRKMDVVEQVEIIINTIDSNQIKKALDNEESIEIVNSLSGPFSLRGKFLSINLKWLIRFSKPSEFYTKLMLSTGSGKHLRGIAKDDNNLQQYLLDNDIIDEEAAYSKLGYTFVEPEMREGTFEIELAKENKLPDLLKLEYLKGPFHNHSKYSDGQNTILQLAEYCIDQGYEYLGLSDHSKSAFYANGLQEYHIKKQHEEIDELNKQLAPFKIFKGIESDILNDGSLDYDTDVLSSFDFIVASVHSNLNMGKEKATQRLLKAIVNPFTTFLGHPTGRLLLRRKGYAIDHKKIIDACALHNVIIEINANPWRLDLDWRWVNYAIDQEVVLSINPDAHEIKGFNHMKFGVFMGRKGGLTIEKTFNAWSLESVNNYLKARKKKI